MGGGRRQGNPVDEETGLLHRLNGGAVNSSEYVAEHTTMHHARSQEKDDLPDPNSILGTMQSLNLSPNISKIDAKQSPEMEFLSEAVARGVADAVGGKVQHAMSHAMHDALEEQHLHFDVKANVGTLVAVTGVILFWRGVWNMWDTVVGLSLTSDLLSMGIGLGTMLSIRYFRVPLARGFPEM